METFVALAVVLASEGFAADCTNERPLVRVRAQMRTKVVGSGKALGAEVALEGGRVFLCATPVCAVGRRPLRVGEIKNVVALV